MMGPRRIMELTCGDTKREIFDELKSNLAEWLTAKDDLFWRPPVEVTERDGEFNVKASLGQANLENLEIMVAREIMLIKGDVRNEPADGAVLHRSEFPHGKLRRSVEFPRPVNPNRVRAEMRDGMLSINAEIAESGKNVVPFRRAA